MPPDRTQEDERDFSFVKIYRKSIKSQVFQNAELWKIFCWCIMKANYRERWVSVTTGSGQTQVHINAGEFIFGRKEAAKELRMPESSVRNRMAKLVDMQNLAVKPDTHFSIVSVTNWDSYQVEKEKEDRQEDNQRTTRGQPEDTDKNVKNLENVKKRTTNTNTRDHHFSDDPLFDFEVFFEATRSVPTMQGWPRQKCLAIHQAMADWSASRSGNKRSDWLAVARTFAKRDSLSMQVNSAGPRQSRFESKSDRMFEEVRKMREDSENE